MKYVKRKSDKVLTVENLTLSYKREKTCQKYKETILVRRKECHFY